MTIRRFAATVRQAFATLGRRQRNRVGSSMSMARRRAVVAALIARVNGNRITAAEYLASIGAPQSFIDQYGSAYGAKVSKEFQSVYGEKPAKNGLALRKGRLYRVFTYTLEQKPVLAAAAAKYNRTAELKGAC